MPSFTGAIHVGLSVTDMERSADWYQRVLGFMYVKTFDAGVPRILLLHPDSGFLVGLYNHERRSAVRFSPLRTGLDHLALAVTSGEELATWSEQLDRLGVPHSPVRDLGHSRFISLEDPDGIQLELWWTITPHTPNETTS